MSMGDVKVDAYVRLMPLDDVNVLSVVLPVVVHVAVVVIVVAVIVVFVVSAVVVTVVAADQSVVIVAIVIRSIVAFDVIPTDSLEDQHLKSKRRTKEIGENENEIETESEMNGNTMVRTSNKRMSTTDERIGRSRTTEGLRDEKDIVKVGKGMMTDYSRSWDDTSSLHS